MTRKEMDVRRLAVGLELHKKIGYLARKYEVHEATIRRWKKLQAEGNFKTLKSIGRSPRVSNDVLRNIALSREGWSGKEFVAEVERQTGVRYDHAHVSQLMQKVGLCLKKKSRKKRLKE